MAGDAYLPADGEIEAEHAWVNEWAGPAASPAAAPHVVVAAPIPAPSTPAIVMPAVGAPVAASVQTLVDEPSAPTHDPASDQLLRDIVEIEFARDMLEREPEPQRATRRRIRMPVTVGGVLALVLVTAASVVAGLIKVR